MEKLELVKLLSGREPEAIIRTLAMMAHIPAIGRVLEEGGVDRFADLMVESVPKFYGYVTREHFDTVHGHTCDRILSSFKTNRNENLSCGQVQKPVNVFLKAYVDWANRPDPELAKKLRPFLHVPVDSILMEFIACEFPDEYDVRIARLRRQLAERIKERLPDSTPRMVERGLFGNEFSLVGINKEIYLAWQEFFRTLWPDKPVMLDIIWVLERAKVRKSGANEAGP